jgi:hypothetical protein
MKLGRVYRTLLKHPQVVAGPRFIAMKHDKLRESRGNAFILEITLLTGCDVV